MGLFDSFINKGQSAANDSKNSNQTFTFANIPQNSSELMALPEASLDSAFKTSALAMAALLRYETNPEEAIDMLNVLYGPQPMSVFAKQFINERLAGKTYKVRSFFAGATVENNYTPTVPYSITIYENPYSFTEENYATMFVKSSGADSLRQIKLRKKPSTGQWFVLELQCLSDIRVPVAEDPWA